MKNLKKFAALLLAGAMALLMLTACGGGGGSVNNVLGYAGAFCINKKQVGNDLAIVITARYDYQNTLLNVVLTEISKYVDTKVDASVNQDGIWSNVGVVVSGDNEQSYIAIAVRIKNYYGTTGK